MSRVQYYGVTRFSTYLPQSNQWALGRQSAVSEQEQQARLFSPERMQPRCDIFIELALPIYQLMADKYDYRHILLYTETLPARYLTQLRDAAERYPVLMLAPVENRIETAPIILADLEANNPDADIVAYFRVDDDDLLAVNYLDRLNVYASGAHEGYAVSFGMGVGGLFEDGMYREFRTIHARLPSQGQAYIGRYDRLNNRLRMPRATTHTKQDTSSPVIYDSRELAYLYTFHDHQDVGIGTTSLTERFGRHPAMTPGTNLSSLFPTLSRRSRPGLFK